MTQLPNEEDEGSEWSGVGEWKSTPEEERRRREAVSDRLRPQERAAAERSRTLGKEVDQHSQRIARNEQVADATLRSADLTVWSNRLAAAAAVAALFALLTSLAAYRLAFSDDEHDRRWRAEQRQLVAEQLRLLSEIRDRLPATAAATGDVAESPR